MESKKRIDIVRLKSIDVVKEGVIHYLPRKITSPKDCYELVKKYIDNCDREMFILITVDTRNQPTAIQTISIGSLNASIVHPRDVFKLAIISNSASVLIAHNHPSGYVDEPSQADRNITKRLIEAGEILGIKVLDHIIIGNDEYYSFKENEEL